MPRGVSPKREREYQELVDEFHQEQRYEGREEEVAARIVNKQRAEHGETKEQRQEDREGGSPDRNLPIKNYDKLTVDTIVSQLDRLTSAQLKQVENYERQHNNRATLLKQIDRRLNAE